MRSGLRCAALAGITLFCSVSGATAQLIVAHRGASHDAPENTLAAFRLAWEQSADAVEGDFYLSRDNRIVCIHDDTTERTGVENLNVAGATLAELQRLDVGAWKSPRFAGERVPTLEQVLQLVPEDKLIYIEVKCGPEIVPHLKSTLEEEGVGPERAVVIAFDAEVIAATKRELPEFQAYWLAKFKQDEQTGRWKPAINQLISKASRIGADGVDVSATPEVVDEAFVKRCRDAGFSVHTWTVDDPVRAQELQALGIDSITTNKPAFLRRALSAAAAESQTPVSAN